VIGDAFQHPGQPGLGAMNAATLMEAHRSQESGRVVGKTVLGAIV